MGTCGTGAVSRTAVPNASENFELKNGKSHKTEPQVEL